VNNISVVMTCHNRRDKTLDCLKRVFSQDLADCQLSVVLVDDGSTDDTSKEVKATYPSVVVIQGSGSLYWSGGMREGMSHALAKAVDYVIWLNDDVLIDHDAFRRLIECSRNLKHSIEKPVIVVGSLASKSDGRFTYGGSVSTSRCNPLRLRHCQPADVFLPCDTFNGNLVLIPQDALKLVGNLHSAMLHGIGDYEYGFRAAKSGVFNVIAPGYFGACERNSHRNTWLESSIGIVTRYKRLFGIKGQPLTARYAYYKMHGGVFWWLLFPLIYLRPLLFLFRKAKK